MGRKFRNKKVRTGRKKQIKEREGGEIIKKDSKTVGESKGVPKKKKKGMSDQNIQRHIFFLMVVSTT